MTQTQRTLTRLIHGLAGSVCLMLLGLTTMVMLPGRMSAQTTTADIVGTVTDSGGAVIPGADISVTNKGTGDVRKVKSGGNGDFVVPVLPPGNYSLQVTMSSFKKYVVPNLALAAGDKPRINAQLAVGDTTQTVSVEATTPLLQSESATLQSSVNQQAVQDMPLNGRNYVQLVQMIPGANEGPPNSLTNGSKPDDKRQSAAFSANGQSDVLNNNMIDGMDNNERLIGSLGVRPSVDAISELHVQTSVYSADTGRTPGAAVNIVTKSGSNSFHGTAYEYFRNDIFNTYPYQFGAHANGGKKLELRQNQFGGSVGGPIKRDKLFFFGDYEAFRMVFQANPTTSVVPTAYQQAHPGDFTDIGGLNYITGPNAAPLDAAALQYWKMFPAPNNGTNASGQGLFVGSSKNRQDSNVLDGKGDYQINQNNSIAARYSYNRVKTYQPGAMPTVTVAGMLVNPNSGGGYAPDIAHSAALTYVHTFTSALLFTGQAGYLRVDNEQYPASFLTGNPPKNFNATIGQPNTNVDLQSAGLARAAFTNGIVTLGGAGNFYPLTDFSQAFQYQGTLAYTHGAHNFKFGAQVIRRQATSVQSVSGAPTWTFPTLQAFIQGQYSSVMRSDNIAPPSYRWWEIGEYAQDDWHVSRSLTLNLGIRWDVYTNKVSPNNRLSNWDNVRNVLAIAGTSGVSASTNLSTKFGLFSPRVGFAYTVRQGLVVRGGFGMSFFPTDITSNPSLKNQPFNVAYGPVGWTASTLFATGGQALPTTVGSTTIPNSAILGAVRGVPTNFRPGEVMQYNLSTQKDFHGNVVTVAYVGVLERHMPQSYNDINAPAPGLYLNATTGKPDANVSQKARPNYGTAPNMTTISWYASEGVGMYNSAQVSAERRLAKGLSFSVNYAYARNQDNFLGISNQSGSTAAYGYYKAGTPAGDRYERANSDLDLRNRMAATINYTLPFFQSASGFKAQALKGWQINTLASWAAGQPQTVANSTNQNGTALGVASSDRPNLIGTPMLNRSDRTLSQYFNKAAFQVQPATQIAAGIPGNSPRNIVYGPHYRHLDLSLIKNFPIREGTSVAFRAEGFNVLNTANFALPGGGLGSSTFGVVNAMSAAYTPRLFQFALKFLF